MDLECNFWNLFPSPASNLPACFHLEHLQILASASSFLLTLIVSTIITILLDKYGTAEISLYYLSLFPGMSTTVVGEAFRRGIEYKKRIIILCAVILALVLSTFATILFQVSKAVWIINEVPFQTFTATALQPQLFSDPNLSALRVKKQFSNDLFDAVQTQQPVLTNLTFPAYTPIEVQSSPADITIEQVENYFSISEAPYSLNQCTSPSITLFKNITIRRSIRGSRVNFNETYYTSLVQYLPPVCSSAFFIQFARPNMICGSQICTLEPIFRSSLTTNGSAAVAQLDMPSFPRELKILDDHMKDVTWGSSTLALYSIRNDSESVTTQATSVPESRSIYFSINQKYFRRQAILFSSHEMIYVRNFDRNSKTSERTIISNAQILRNFISQPPIGRNNTVRGFVPQGGKCEFVNGTSIENLNDATTGIEKLISRMQLAVLVHSDLSDRSNFTMGVQCTQMRNTQLDSLFVILRHRSINDDSTEVFYTHDFISIDVREYRMDSDTRNTFFASAGFRGTNAAFDHVLAEVPGILVSVPTAADVNKPPPIEVLSTFAVGNSTITLHFKPLRDAVYAIPPFIIILVLLVVSIITAIANRIDMVRKKLPLIDKPPMYRFVRHAFADGEVNLADKELEKVRVKWDAADSDINPDNVKAVRWVLKPTPNEP
ncbi:hypothetical protein HK098_002590 [Nowakowskiella sp. JEL0407]|nr:hypothetical protein HK098_002590 [Nowakowskiella sp. JEL0407]